MSGVVTAVAIAVVFALLGRYQVPDYADRDGSLGLAGTLAAMVAAVALIAVIRAPARHAVVALLLIPAAILPLVLGAERNRLEAALIWCTAALAVHVLLSGRRWSTVGIVVTCVAAVLATWGLQDRWRAQKFEAVGVPLVVPEGYRLTGVWAGRYSVALTLRGPSAQTTYAVIERGPCPASTSEVRCLRDDAGIRLVPPGRIGSVREVSGSTLADFPDDATWSEPD